MATAIVGLPPLLSKFAPVWYSHTFVVFPLSSVPSVVSSLLRRVLASPSSATLLLQSWATHHLVFLPVHGPLTKDPQVKDSLD